MTSSQTITPLLRYRDVAAAAQWLCQAFGFREDHIAKWPTGEIRHISLRLGNSVVLACPAQSLLEGLMFQPDMLSGANTQTCYLTVQNVDAHCAHARRAGAKIEFAPETDDTGFRTYVCRDFEGYLWSFGTQNIGAEHVDAEGSPARWNVRPSAALAAGLALAIAGLSLRSDTASVDGVAAVRMPGHGPTLHDKKPDEHAQKPAIERAFMETTDRLQEQRAVNAGLQEKLQSALAEIAQVQQSKATADQALSGAKAGKDRSEQSAAAALAALNDERAAAAQAREAVQRAQSEMTQLRKVKEDAVRAQKEATAALKTEEARRIEAQSGLEALRIRAGELEATVQAELQSKAQGQHELAALRNDVAAQKAAADVANQAERQRATEEAGRAIAEAQKLKDAADRSLSEVRAELLKLRTEAQQKQDAAQLEITRLTASGLADQRSKQEAQLEAAALRVQLLKQLSSAGAPPRDAPKQ
jgi:uncharacterized glyoxalase superfamily protein PhnB